MKKLFYLLSCVALIAGLTACSDDKEEFKNPPSVSIELAEGDIDEVAQGETVVLKAKIESLLKEVEIRWSLNGKEVSTEASYTFVADELGKHEIQLMATNADGIGTATKTIHVVKKSVVSIEAISGSGMAIKVGETLKLKANVQEGTATRYSWIVNEKEISTQETCDFTSDKEGTFTLQLVIYYGEKGELTASATATITVFNYVSSINNIKFWVGEGSNRSALCIQWIKGTEWEEPKEEDVNHLCWGYQWNDSEKPTGDMLIKAVAKADPRLYVVFGNAWGGSVLWGFAYDGNNDGKITIKDADGAVIYTEKDFTDGVFIESKAGKTDDLVAADSEDYWLGGWYSNYASYWIGKGENTPKTMQFEYSPVVAGQRALSNNSWDAWTFSSINSGMVNTYPFSQWLMPALRSAE